MENATKALLIAAAILIAIVIITLGVFVLGKGSTLVKENSDMSSVEVSTYNDKFENYCGSNIRGSNVRQLISTVNQHNRTYAGDVSKQITLTLSGDGSATLGATNTSYSIDAIKTGYAYDVEATYDNGSSLITSIAIKKK